MGVSTQLRRRAREQTLEILQGVQREVGVPLRAPPGHLPTLRVVDGWVLDKGLEIVTGRCDPMRQRVL